MPRELREHFEKVLRLSFYDVEERRHLRPRQFPKRIPKRADTRSTAGRGYRDRPRSTLQRIRPRAGPHQRIVEWFDAELGCNLSAVNARIGDERMARWKEELDLTEDSLLEELLAVE